MDDPFARAKVLLEQNRPDLAEREVYDRLAERPDDVEGYILLAHCFGAQKNFVEASDVARHVLELDPGRPEGHFLLAASASNLGRLDEADRAIRIALEMRPEEAEYRFVKAHILLQKKDFRGAVAEVDECLEIEPEHVLGLNLRAVALENLGRHEESAALVGEALALDPEAPGTHCLRGRQLAEAGHFGQGKAHLEEALRLDPNNEDARQGLIWILRAENRLYGFILRIIIWLANFHPKRHWVIFLFLFAAFLFGEGMLNDLTGRRWPGLLLTGAVVAFFAIRTAGEQFANVCLRFHPQGRKLLRLSEWSFSLLSLLLYMGSAGAYIAFAAWPEPRWIRLAGVLLLLSMIALGHEYPPQGRPVRVRVWTLATFAVAGVWLVAGMDILHPLQTFFYIYLALVLMIAFLGNPLEYKKAVD